MLPYLRVWPNLSILLMLQIFLVEHNLLKHTNLSLNFQSTNLYQYTK